jgi:threonine aldolase
MLAGSKDFIKEAWYKRKIMGGGMRQTGILAAAGIIALEEHPALLAEDHSRARSLEKALSEIPGISVEQGDINIVFFNYKGKICDPAWAQTAIEEFRSRGITINAPALTKTDNEINFLFRFVTHYWIGDNELAKIIEAARSIFSSV